MRTCRGGLKVGFSAACLMKRHKLFHLRAYSSAQTCISIQGEFKQAETNSCINCNISSFVYKCIFVQCTVIKSVPKNFTQKTSCCTKQIYLCPIVGLVGNYFHECQILRYIDQLYLQSPWKYRCQSNSAILHHDPRDNPPSHSKHLLLKGK